MSAVKKSKGVMTPEEFARETSSSRKPQKYILKLYVTGMTSRSRQAIQNIKKICEDNLKDRYDLEIIDIYKKPTLAKGDQIIAAPTLIRKLPLPIRKFIGTITNEERILLGLDLKKS